MVALKHILFSNIVLGFTAENSCDKRDKTWHEQTFPRQRATPTSSAESSGPEEVSHNSLSKDQYETKGPVSEVDSCSYLHQGQNKFLCFPGWHIACVLSAPDDSHLCLLMLIDYLIEPGHKPNVSKQLVKWRSPRFDVADTYNCLVRQTKLAKDRPNHNHRRNSHPLSKPQHTKD